MVNEELLKAVKKAKCFLLDMDGTIYVGDKLIGEMDKTLSLLRENGKKIIFLTNNSSKSKVKYEEKLRAIGLFSNKDSVYTSGIATAEYLNLHYKGKSVYLLGTDALKQEFKSMGVNLVEDKTPDVCVLAYDTELTYEKLCKFVTYLKRGAYYIATHPDVNCPHPEVFVPDVGAFMKLIEESTGLTPSVIIGKPYSGMGDNLMQTMNLSSDKFIMVGDRLHTDIAFGNACGFTAILVLSGEAKTTDIGKLSGKPDFVLDSLNDIVEYLKE
ncbi:MAG: HAD-IIA family hydrolase [Clostridiales bacterium]|nr:HAD-IIA family hydrolase [Clostridiales bacterium]